MSLQEKVYNALKSLDLPTVKYIHEYNGEYPVLVYREISNVPSIHGDDMELESRITYQISIGTADDNYSEIENEVEKAMLELEFMRVDSEDIYDECYWRVIRYIKIEVKENE